MSIETYRLLHISGLLFLFLGLGAILLPAQGGSNKMGTMMHGIGMVLMLFAGFGAITKGGISFPWPLWVWGKLIIWVLIGILPSMHKRNVIPAKVTWIVAIGFGVTAAYLAFFKPFA